MATAALTVDLNARIAQFESEMKRATTSLDKFGKKGDSIAAGFKSAFGVLGATLSVGALASFAKSGIDAADSLAKMSVRTGVATRDLASFQLAADSADTSMEGVAKGLGKLNRSIGEAENGNKLIAASLKELGVTAKDPKEAFYQLADATERIQDPTKRAYLLNNVLGKSYEELVPLLSQGSDALRKSAQDSETFADAMARLAPEAEKFNDQLTLIKNNAAGVAASGLYPLVKSLNEYIAAMREVVATGNLLDKIAFFGFGFINEDTLNKISKASDRVQDYNVKIFETQQQLLELRRVEGSGSPNVAIWEKKIADLERTRASLVTQARKDAEAAKNIIKPGGGGSIKPGSSASGSKADPLAGLLASTDIGRLEAFDKQVALLNQRFDGGRKNAELYSQAMTKLVESTFSANFSEFNKQLQEQDETQRLVADHLQATNDALYAQQQAWVDAGRALEDEMRTPLENANIEFARLQDLLDRGVISWETYTRAVFKTQEAIASVPEALQEMDTFAKTAAKNIQNSFADFLFDPFENGLKGMAQSFGQMIQKMIADAVAADLTRKLFGENGGGGIAGGLLEGFGKLLGFEQGGIMTSAGPLPLNSYAGGGIANRPQLALFGEGRMNEAYVPLPDGRNIPVKMQGGGGNTYIINVYGTNNAPDVRRAAGQGMREAIGFMNGARRYG